MNQDPKLNLSCFNLNKEKQMKKMTALMLVLALNLGSIAYAAEEISKDQYIEKAVASGMDSGAAEDKFSELDKDQDGKLSTDEQK